MFAVIVKVFSYLIDVVHNCADMSLRDGLFHDYKKYGKVARVCLYTTGHVKYAIVWFRKPEDAQKALEGSHDKKIFGCKVQVYPVCFLNI